MDFPFPQYPWDASSRPRHGRSFRGIPVQVMPEASSVQSLKPNTVSIPVRFVCSERGRSDSAIKIQKVFRGFLVRKNVKKIMAIREEVNEMERRVLQKETVELIRNDSKEKLKANEILMSLLFKLDSVSGVDSRVRDLRKSVIKKAIALQQLVDAIVSGDQPVNSSNAEAVDQRQHIIDSSDNCIQSLESENLEETTNDAERVPESCEPEGTAAAAAAAAAIQGNEEETSETNGIESFANHENTIEEDDENEGEEKGMKTVSEEENGRKEMMLEKIMEDNEKMMRLMEKLSERNETQTRMLCALTQRVEQLEKAFLCDKLRRKKRRNDEKSQDTKKCGGKRSSTF
ncbi:putative PERQ amino acid-rich with GYF domain-containing protein 1 [Hibiscus syriacus]|uniref:PERQ amino acid-rich with GYF domain-containing protein 1 n=1 Tax=Hibiscus syriacus TaxID=106335 RepID=A0A6A2YL97_HIBSY|nr:uncharacterized protein LOC120160448 [Hibiscus syriacus]KAE8680207.1 putative PERQ amino acid-rich with GYF domain-containing protein 1 [Hibiscus syriacus]